MLEDYASEDLIAFSVLLDKDYIANWHHDVLADKLMAVERGEITRLMIFMPPRHGKSQLATINFPAWYLGRNKKKEVIVASYSGELATDFGGKTRAIIRDTAFQRIFRGMTLEEGMESKGRWQTNEGGSYTSVGVGGAITGKGANILIIDDPIKNSEEANSQVYRDKVWDWYRTTARTRLEKDGAIVVILTRWHQDDIAGRMLLQDGGSQWDVLCLPAIAEIEEEYRAKGEPLWSSKYDLQALDEIKKDVGPYAWSALYQQKPILNENQEFKNIWFKSIPREQVMRLNTRRFLTVDTAYSQKTSADYIGITENYVDRENNWNFASYRMKLDPKELIDYLFTIQELRGFERIGIEETAFTVGLKPFLDEEMRKRNKFLPIFPLKHNQISKEERIRGLIPRYSSGSIYHIAGECKDLEAEEIAFPRGTNDDCLDSAAYQLQIARENKPKKQTVTSDFEVDTPYYG
jgi:hypothetical protein